MKYLPMIVLRLKHAAKVFAGRGRRYRTAPTLGLGLGL
jgi:hypothetical protein